MALVFKTSGGFEQSSRWIRFPYTPVPFRFRAEVRFVREKPVRDEFCEAKGHSRHSAPNSDNTRNYSRQADGKHGKPLRSERRHQSFLFKYSPVSEGQKRALHKNSFAVHTEGIGQLPGRIQFLQLSIFREFLCKAEENSQKAPSWTMACRRQRN